MTAPRGHVWRALASRNYRLFFVGQGLSLIGTWFTRYAMYRETYALSHSTFELGLVAFFSQAPTACITPIAGVLVDRWNRYHTLVVTQALAMVQSALLAVFALANAMTVWHILALASFQAVINAFDMPARQSFVRQMVDRKEDLPNAIALNSSLVNIARMIGPAIAAALAHFTALGWCFAIDAASYVAVIAALLAMRVAAQPIRPRDKRVLEEMRDGFRYVRRQRTVRDLLLLFAVTGTFGGAYIAMMPAIAAALGGGGDGQGLLMGAAGAGALVGSIYLANQTRIDHLPALITKCGVVVGIAMMAFELAPSTAAALPMAVALGGGLVVQWAATNTVAQAIVDEDKLGRVLSLYALVYFAGAPVGALVEGTLAHAIGSIHTFAIAGAGCLACSLAFRRGIGARMRAHERS